MTTTRQVTILIRGDASGLLASVQQARQALGSLTQGIQQQNQQAQQSVDQTAQRYEGFKRTLGGLRELAGGLGVAIVAAIGASTAVFAGFEQAMNRSYALAGLTSREFAQLGREVLALAPQMGRGPKEMAEGLYFVISAGFQASQSMKILEAATKASAAEGSNLSIVGEGLTSIMKAYGLSANDAERVTDMMTVAVVEGKLEFDNLAGSIGRVAPIAKISGISISEMLASLTLMTRTGLSADEAATALRAALQNLEKPSKQAKEFLAQVGYTAEGLRYAIKERGLVDVLQELMQKTDGNVEVLGRIVPNIRGLVGVLSAASGGFEEYRRVVAEVEHSQGRTNEAFEKTTQTLSFQMHQLGATVQTTMVSIGQAFAPVAKNWVGGVNEMVAGSAKFLAQNPEWTESAVRVAAVVGAMLVGVGGVRAFGAALYMVGVGLGPMFVGLRAANLEMMKLAGPIGLAAAAFVGLRAAADTNIPVISQLGRAFSALPTPLQVAVVGMPVFVQALRSLFTLVSGGIAGLQLLTTTVTGLVAAFRAYSAVEGFRAAMMAMLAGINPVILALAAIGVALVALDRALAAFTGRGLLDRVLGRDPAAAKAHADALEAAIRQLGRTMDGLKTSAQVQGWDDYTLSLKRFLTVVAPVEAALLRMQQFMANMAKPVQKDDPGISDMMQKQWGKKLADDLQSITPKIEASTKALKEMRLNGELLPNAFQFQPVIDQLRQMEREVGNSNTGLRDTLRNFRTEMEKARDASRNATSNIATDFVDLGVYAQQGGRTVQQAVRDMMSGLKQEIEVGIGKVNALKKALGDLMNVPTREMNDASAVIAFLDANADAAARSVLGLDNSLGGATERAYAMAQRMGLVNGEATTAEQKMSALTAKNAEGTRVIETVNNALGLSSKAHGALAQSMDESALSLDEHNISLRINGQELQLTSRSVRDQQDAYRRSNAEIAAAVSAEVQLRDAIQRGLVPLADGLKKLGEMNALRADERAALDTSSAATEHNARMQEWVAQGLATVDEKTGNVVINWDKVGKAAQTAGTDTKTGMDTAKSGVNEFSGVIDTLAAEMGPKGKAVGDGLVTGINEPLPAGKLSAEQILLAIGTAINLAPKGQGIAAGLIAGLLAGLAAGMPSVQAAAARASEAASDSFMEEARIRSPSQVWRYFGEMLVAGLAEGIDNNHIIFKQSIDSLFQEVVDDSETWVAAVDSVGESVARVLAAVLTTGQLTDEIANLDAGLKTSARQLKAYEADTKGLEKQAKALSTTISDLRDRQKELSDAHADTSGIDAEIKAHEADEKVLRSEIERRNENRDALQEEQAKRQELSENLKKYQAALNDVIVAEMRLPGVAEQVARATGLHEDAVKRLTDAYGDGTREAGVFGSALRDLQVMLDAVNKSAIPAATAIEAMKKAISSGFAEGARGEARSSGMDAILAQIKEIAESDSPERIAELVGRIDQLGQAAGLPPSVIQGLKDLVEQAQAAGNMLGSAGRAAVKSYNDQIAASKGRQEQLQRDIESLQKATHVDQEYVKSLQAALDAEKLQQTNLEKQRDGLTGVNGLTEKATALLEPHLTAQNARNAADKAYVEALGKNIEATHTLLPPLNDLVATIMALGSALGGDQFLSQVGVFRQQLDAARKTADDLATEVGITRAELEQFGSAQAAATARLAANNADIANWATGIANGRLELDGINRELAENLDLTDDQRAALEARKSTLEGDIGAWERATKAVQGQNQELSGVVSNTQTLTRTGPGAASALTGVGQGAQSALTPLATFDGRLNDLVGNLDALAVTAGEGGHFIGWSLAQGMLTGIVEGAPAIAAAAEAAVLAAIAAAKKAAGIASPSKKAAQEIGKPIAQGIMQGMSSLTDEWDAFWDDILGKGLKDKRSQWADTAKQTGLAVGQALTEGVRTATGGGKDDDPMGPGILRGSGWSEVVMPGGGGTTIARQDKDGMWVPVMFSVPTYTRWAVSDNGAGLDPRPRVPSSPISVPSSPFGQQPPWPQQCSCGGAGGGGGINVTVNGSSLQPSDVTRMMGNALWEQGHDIGMGLP